VTWPNPWFDTGTISDLWHADCGACRADARTICSGFYFGITPLLYWTSFHWRQHHEILFSSLTLISKQSPQCSATKLEYPRVHICNGRIQLLASRLTAMKAEQGLTNADQDAHSSICIRDNVYLLFVLRSINAPLISCSKYDLKSHIHIYVKTYHFLLELPLQTMSYQCKTNSLFCDLADKSSICR
jgi:hypothetical protein